MSNHPTQVCGGPADGPAARYPEPAESGAPVVICRAGVGDPAALGESALLERDPRAVLEGLARATWAAGAAAAHVYLGGRAADCRAILAREAAILAGEDAAVTIEIHEAPAALVCSEVTAFLRAIEGGRPVPEFSAPPALALCGPSGEELGRGSSRSDAAAPPTLFGGPVLVTSLAELVGGPGAAARVPFTMTGDVRSPGAVEAPPGTTLRELVFEHGGGVAAGARLKAVVVGGPAGGWLPPDLLDTPADDAALRAAGVHLGAGTVQVVAAPACVVHPARAAMEVLARENCGKCVVCREGTMQMAEILGDVAEGRGRPGDLDLLYELARALKLLGTCEWGRTAADPVLSALAHFRPDFEAHLRGRGCPAGVDTEETGRAAAASTDPRATVAAGPGTPAEPTVAAGPGAPSAPVSAGAPVAAEPAAPPPASAGPAAAAGTAAAASTVALEIDGRSVETAAGRTLLEAALAAGVYIPHLCSHPELEPAGACGLCIVHVAGVDGPVYSCHTEARAGMVVSTKSDDVLALRRLTMELILSRHPPECTTCTQYLNCELQSLKQFVGVTEELRVRKHSQPIPPDASNPLFVRDMTKCVLCGRCVRACRDLRGVDALAFHDIGRATRTGPTAGGSMAESGCRFCGACVEVCPTGALRDVDQLTRGRNRRTALLPCRYTCPAEIDVPRYVRLAREGDYGAATAVVREKAPFPLTLGYVCDHPCEAVCRRGVVNEPVAIRELKRVAALRDDGSWKERRRRVPDSGRRVAVVGSGPAGLTAAYYLRSLGHAVTVYESLPVAGGMLRVGIPEDRLPRYVVDAEIAEIEAAGVEIRFSTPVVSLDALADEGWDAVLLAVGTHRGGRLPVPGADSEKVLSAVEFLRAVHLGGQVGVGESVLVLGGGNVAFDCARVARTLGAERVEVACLEGRDALPASPEEAAAAEAAGIVVHDSRTFRGIAVDDAGVCTVECLAVESFAFDDEGRLEVEEVWGSEHTLRADTVILALGQRPVVPEEWGVDLTAAGTVALDEYTFETSREAVFAAGDAVSGTASVIQAVASGRRAAAVIDRRLGGSGDLDERLADETAPAPWLGPGPGFADLVRPSSPWGEGDACGEAERCLQCDLRLKMERVRFWGDY